MTTTPTTDAAWAPAACTLPTADQPVRIAEFDAFFATHVQRARRTVDRVVLELTGGPEAAATAADLAARETACCSFFAFGLSITDGTTTLTVTIPAEHADVLAALADRAEALAGTAR